MIGEHIHGYEIKAHLGQGGMGNVFRATDKMLGRDVALKMLHPQLTKQPQFLERFKKEARVLAQLLHPNIAVIYNLIEQNDDHFMVMEYVEGTNLDELLKKYRVIPTQLVVPIFIQALEGLQHAHKKNIFHRDIKPSNLMLTPEGTLKLMDFGIAKMAGEQKMTQVNKIVGTVEFMAPELIEGKPASVASDIYAMGATLYELISGKLPFESDTDYNLMQAILKNKVRPPDKLNPSVPKALNDIVLKALEKKPENRYPNARAFQQALTAAFPNYREIDLSVLKLPAQPKRDSGSNMAPTQEMAASPSMETRAEETAKPLSALQLFQQKFLSGQNFPFIIGGTCLLAAIIIILSIALRRNHDSIEGGNASVALKDTSNQPGKNTRHINNTPDGPVTSPETIEKLPAPIVKDTQTAEKPVRHETEKTRKKKSEKKEETGKKTEDEPVVKPVEKKAEETPEKVVQKKEIYIDSKLEVNLYLRETLGESDKDQAITFSVTSPVTYDGVVIIRQGAIARGTIKIGRMMTSINIDYVMGANGQELALKSGRLHRRRSELASDRNYTAVLEKGIRMNF